ncbi:hypothetical protein KCU65_g4355, partial [Aureobasidium melanogenum]
MSKRTETDTPAESVLANEISKKPRLDLHDQIQRAVALATQLCQGSSKEHLTSTEWIDNQAAANELLRTMENMQEKTTITAEAMKSLLTAQIKLEVKFRMNALSTKISLNWALGPEIKEHLAPEQADSRERIAEIALGKLEGVESVDLADKVTEAVKAAILDEFHKGIDNKLRKYML